MKPVKIITDTCSDITVEIAKEHGIHLLPVHIVFGDEEFSDRYEITAEEFYIYCQDNLSSVGLFLNDT